MKTRKSVIYSILLLIGSLILLNILSFQYFVRLDLTDTNKYTLSDATEQILGSLDRPVTVSAYFSENLPPQYSKVRREFKDILVEYARRSDGMVKYEFINPEDQKTKQKAMQSGVRPVLISVQEQDQMKQQRAFLGAVIQMGNQKEVIPLIKPNTSLEYNLSSNIKKLSVEEKPKIGLLQGHGEPSRRNLGQVMNSLSVLYNVETVSLSDTTYNLDPYRTLAIIAPTDSFPQSHLDQLDRYLAEGNHLFVGLNRVEGNLQRRMGEANNTGLGSWLKDKGINIQEKFVTDARCASIGVTQQQGGFQMQTNVQFPYIPLISNFADHSITKGLETVVLKFASPIEFTGDSSLTYTPLAMTSKNAGTQRTGAYFNINKQWNKDDFPMSNVTVASALEGPIQGNTQSKMVVVSDGDFPVNESRGRGRGQRGQRSQINKDNVNLFVNSVDWLSDVTGLINLRTKGITSRPLEQVEDGRRIFLKYFNFLLPIILIIIFGIFRHQYNKNLRIKRMEKGYV